MNVRGGLIGVLLAVIVAVAVFVGLQMLIWGGTAPDWYIAPDMLGSAIFGWAGAALGARYL